MLSHMFILRKSKNFTSNFLIYISQIIPINHYKGVSDARLRARQTNVLFYYLMLKSLKDFKVCEMQIFF